MPGSLRRPSLQGPWRRVAGRGCHRPCLPLASDGPATVTDLAARLPITRQAIAKHLALMIGAGLVTPAPGERRRVLYRLRSAPVQLAQQFLAALAHEWDDRLAALQHHLTAG